MRTEAPVKTRSGFTIVELLIVIVVIAILAAITITSYSGIQSRARDSQRAAAITSIQKKLEAFYVLNGYYPNNFQIQQADFIAQSLQLPNSAVIPPGTTERLRYCWADNPGMYCYVAANSGGDCNGATDQCLKYRMSYRLEATSGTQTVLYSPNWTW